MNKYIKCNNDDEVLKCQEFFMKKKFKWFAAGSLSGQFLEESNFSNVLNRQDLLPVYFQIKIGEIRFFNCYIEKNNMFKKPYKIIEFKKFLRKDKINRINESNIT